MAKKQEERIKSREIDEVNTDAVIDYFTTQFYNKKTQRKTQRKNEEERK